MFDDRGMNGIAGFSRLGDAGVWPAGVCRRCGGKAACIPQIPPGICATCWLEQTKPRPKHLLPCPYKKEA